MIIPISAVKEKLVYMQCEGEELAFVSRFPNRVKSDGGKFMILFISCACA